MRLKLKFKTKRIFFFEKERENFRKLEREKQLGGFEKDKKQTKSQLVDLKKI